MENKELLNGWKEIANYVGVSTKTAQRYSKNKKFPLPIIKLKSGKVVAYKRDIDRWIKSGGKNKATKNNAENLGATENINKNSSTTEHKIQEYEEKNIEIKQKKKIGKKIYLTITIVLIVLAFFFISINTLKSINSQKIIYLNKSKLITDIKMLDTVAILKIYNENDKLIKKFSYDFKTPRNLATKCKFINERPPFYSTGDVNGDGLEDLVVTNPEDKTELDLYFQTKEHKLSLKGKKIFDIKHFFRDRNYDISNIRYVNIGDVDNDGKDDIVLTLNNSILYPSCLLVLDENLNVKFTLFHPGWLSYTDIKDLNHDGRNELYISGTNNYIYKRETSEEIAIGLEGKLNGKTLDLYGPDGTMFNYVPEGIKLSYVRLNYLKKFCSRFQIPKILKNKSARNVKNSFIVAGGPHIEKKGSTYMQTFLRCFYFGYMLKFKYALWEYENLKYMGIKLTEEEDKNLLIPHYWNGKSWQDNWCLVPQK